MRIAAALAGFGAAFAVGCGNNPAPERMSRAAYKGGDAPISRAADRGMLAIPAAKAIVGSTPQEREQAYQDYRRTSGHDSARRGKWFAREEERHAVNLPAYRIDQTPVTNAAYAEFVDDTGREAPHVDAATWKKQGFIQKYDTQVARFNWRGKRPPPGREDHPVVLVTWQDAHDYCAWRGAVVGQPRRLPTHHEYEKAARGAGGVVYPWGNSFDASKLNSQVEGPVDTTPVGSYPQGKSPYGMLDAAGNVFQWTSTPWPHRKNTMTVKGSAWDDYGGLGRGAAQHGRRRWVHHAIVGFRCVAPAKR
jgi:formylglycine-generating enzyme required for sulfatase activity